jgi:uncharacterized coiled-coil protein SlyX
MTDIVERLHDHARNVGGDDSFERLYGDEACQIADEIERLRADVAYWKDLFAEAGSLINLHPDVATANELVQMSKTLDDQDAIAALRRRADDLMRRDRDEWKQTALNVGKARMEELAATSYEIERLRERVAELEAYGDIVTNQGLMIMELQQKLAASEARLEEQLRTIVALNDALGGEGSLTTDNLTKLARLEEEFQKQRETAAAMVSHRDSLLAALETRVRELEADRLSDDMALVLRATIRDLREQLAAREKDAERYRWLRDKGDTQSGYAICNWDGGAGDWFRVTADLDASIDKAMEGKA